MMTLNWHVANIVEEKLAKLNLLLYSFRVSVVQYLLGKLLFDFLLLTFQASVMYLIVYICFLRDFNSHNLGKFNNFFLVYFLFKLSYFYFMYLFSYFIWTQTLQSMLLFLYQFGLIFVTFIGIRL